jgi:SAM-dependent methyltransferase
VVECQECGCGFVNPRPTEQEISRYYPAEFYSTLRKAALTAKEVKRFSAQAKYVLDAIPATARPRLLDIGCANGDFVEFMQERGLDAEGVEPSHIADVQDGLRIFRGAFPDLPGDTQPYQAITAWAVLEHVHDPRAYFLKASSALVNDGIFVFMIPNFASLASRRLFAEDVPRHLYFFTPDNIRRYADETGFRVELIDFSNPVFVHDPHRLLHFVVSKVARRKWTWPPPPSYTEFVKAKYLARGMYSFLLFCMAHPIGVVDRIVAPLWGRYERLVGKYMVCVYVLRKRAR